MTTDYEITAMLRAYEGPARAATRPRPRAFRARWVAVPALAAAAVLAGAVLLLRDGGAATTAALPALPPGGPQALAPQPSLGMVIAVSLDEAIAQADVVFVGSVTAIGGEEDVDGVPAQRVRYDVEQMLRGDAVDEVDLTSAISLETSFPAEVGKRYLVFAEETPLGQEGALVLVPVGAAQGVYDVVDGTATNALTGESVSLDDVSRRVEARTAAGRRAEPPGERREGGPCAALAADPGLNPARQR